MNIEDLTIRETREIAALLGGHAAKPCPFAVGTAYLIRTVTHYWLGRVERVAGDFLVLSDAAWVADTGRYHQATSVAALAEVEPVEGTAIVGLGAVVDAREWSGALAREPK